MFKNNSNKNFISILICILTIIFTNAFAFGANSSILINAADLNKPLSSEDLFDNFLKNSTDQMDTIFDGSGEIKCLTYSGIDLNSKDSDVILKYISESFGGTDDRTLKFDFVSSKANVSVLKLFVSNGEYTYFVNAVDSNDLTVSIVPLTTALVTSGVLDVANPTKMKNLKSVTIGFRGMRKFGVDDIDIQLSSTKNRPKFSGKIDEEILKGNLKARGFISEYYTSNSTFGNMLPSFVTREFSINHTSSTYQLKGSNPFPEILGKNYSSGSVSDYYSVRLLGSIYVGDEPVHLRFVTRDTLDLSLGYAALQHISIVVNGMPYSSKGTKAGEYTRYEIKLGQVKGGIVNYEIVLGGWLSVVDYFFVKVVDGKEVDLSSQMVLRSSYSNIFDVPPRAETKGFDNAEVNILYGAEVFSNESNYSEVLGKDIGLIHDNDVKSVVKVSNSDISTGNVNNLIIFGDLRHVVPVDYILIKFSKTINKDFVLLGGRESKSGDIVFNIMYKGDGKEAGSDFFFKSAHLRNNDSIRYFALLWNDGVTYAKNADIGISEIMIFTKGINVLNIRQIEDIAPMHQLNSAIIGYLGSTYRVDLDKYMTETAGSVSLPGVGATPIDVPATVNPGAIDYSNSTGLAVLRKTVDGNYITYTASFIVGLLTMIALLYLSAILISWVVSKVTGIDAIKYVSFNVLSIYDTNHYASTGRMVTIAVVAVILIVLYASGTINLLYAAILKKIQAACTSLK